MIKPDIIISWPRNCDYPLWREMIRKNRAQFNEVVIVFTETYQGHDYRQFVRQAMFEDHVLLVQSPLPSGRDDWRNIAVNFALLQSLHSEWIWFTEQDFFPLPGFWEFASEMVESEKADVLQVMEGDRLHPCSLLIKRSVLNQTRKNFGIVPDVSDHFSLLQDDINRMSSNEELNIVVKTVPTAFYHHMAGLSHNLRLAEEGQEIFHAPLEFQNYLAKCFQLDIPLDDHFKETYQKYAGVSL